MVKHRPRFRLLFSRGGVALQRALRSILTKQNFLYISSAAASTLEEHPLNAAKNGAQIQKRAPRGSACGNCRLRKVRCDRQVPCHGCMHAGVVCSFEISRGKVVEAVPRPEGAKGRKTAGKKRGPSTQDVRMRIETLLNFH
jgi:hypothetical protein